MKEIKLEDFTIVPILSSLRRVDMSDDEYFSKTYRDYVSNSRLKNINPEEGGSPALYKNPPHITSQSLCLGSAVHQAVLQPESFVMAPKLGRPTAKLGNCIDYIIKYRKQGCSIYESIIRASVSADYYKDRLTDTKIKEIIKKGLKYYLASKSLKKNEIVLSDPDWDTATKCIKSLQNNQTIMDKLHPTTILGDEIPSYNEDAMFIDYAVLYQGRSTILKYKMKIDNWTIDKDDKILTLNDLKTSFKPVNWFMNSEYGSFVHYHYARQFAFYSDVLRMYCMKEYGYNQNDWTFKANVLVVSTSEDCSSKCYAINPTQIKRGRKEYQELLKRVAYYEMFGYDEEVKFV